MADKKEWMLGLPGHTTVVTLEDVVLLVKGGQIRPTDLVKRLGQPWRAANEVPELVEYFQDPSKPQPPAKPPPLRVAGSSAVKDKPKTTRSIPKADPKPTSRKIPKPEVAAKRPQPTTRRAASASRPPEEKQKPSESRAAATDAAAPAAETKAAPEDTKSAAEARPGPADTKPADVPGKKTRAIPKPPPRVVPRLEPMIGKYYSPVDLLRSASFSFEPKKLLISAAMLIPLMVVSWLSDYLSVQMPADAASQILYLFGFLVLVLGFAFVLVALAYVTRRQLEGQPFRISDVISYTGSNLLTAIVYPLVVTIPSLLAIAILWLLGLVRALGSPWADMLKIGYIIPMIFALIGVGGVLLYQLGSMYVPAAAAIEGQGLTGAVNYAWNFIRRQWGRVVLHWLIITVAFGVIAAVCLGLAWLALQLPEWLFREVQRDSSAAIAWASYEGLMVIYRGLAYGLGMTLPMSLLSTLGTLSYVSLRHPGSEQLTVAPLEETSGIPIQGPRATTVPPPDQTHPAETRPAPADYSGADSKPPDPPPPQEGVGISDDSDEQPLVKE